MTPTAQAPVESVVDLAPASGEARALAELGELYAELDRELAALAPKCELSGRCCDFPTSGLTLFATDLELTWLRRREGARQGGDERLCPYWQRGRCEAREGRPLGCRLYFCDASKAEDLDRLSARYHDRLKRLHERCDHPYRYGPFLPRARAAPPAETCADRENGDEFRAPRR